MSYICHALGVTATRHPKLKREAWARLTEAHGWDTPAECARQIGVTRAQLYRVLSGDRHPGAAFIHGVMCAFPKVSYHDLFEDGAGLWPRRRCS